MAYEECRRSFAAEGSPAATGAASSHFLAERGRQARAALTAAASSATKTAEAVKTAVSKEAAKVTEKVAADGAAEKDDKRTLQ
jgi:hypothetical protein